MYGMYGMYGMYFFKNGMYVCNVTVCMVCMYVCNVM